MLRRIILFVGCLGGMLAFLVIWVYPATAGPADPRLQSETPTPVPTPEPTRIPNLSLSDTYCLDCHGEPDQTYQLPSGEILDLYIPEDAHQNSVHGELGYACVQCHDNVGEYPHTLILPNDRRGVTLLLNRSCARCHQHQFELAEDDAHTDAQRAGIREAAVCADCHTAHEVRRLTDSDTGELLPETRRWIPQRCALCHNAIYQRYRNSVHGAALTQDDNPDVPTCISCHGVHNIADPTTSYFRLNSPEICAECHTNPQIMNKYGISTNVLSTYVADFHGTTVAIFERSSPDAEVNQAVCYDCHGIHDIQEASDPQSNMKVNLLAKCQACHPDANRNFPDAWMSHYTPSPQEYPLVYWIDMFYKFFIPVVLGGMGVLVLLDLSRMKLLRRGLLRPALDLQDAAEARPAVTPAGEQPAPEPLHSDAVGEDAIEMNDAPGGALIVDPPTAERSPSALDGAAPTASDPDRSDDSEAAHG